MFGAYPGINSSTGGSLGANSGGSPTALGTAGIDFRKTYITAGTATFGTIKLGRDIGLFGQDAILNDQTLLGVGATGSNADPGNTSLGRIGYGYVYADFMPQITYISPIWAGSVSYTHLAFIMAGTVWPLIFRSASRSSLTPS